MLLYHMTNTSLHGLDKTHFCNGHIESWIFPYRLCMNESSLLPQKMRRHPVHKSTHINSVLPKRYQSS